MAVDNNKRFWANSNAEAKRKYRFLLNVSKGGQSFEQWLIQKVSRPSFQINEATHSYLNHTFYFPGRLTWQDVSFSVVDAVNPDSTAMLMGMLASSGYRLPSQAINPKSQGTISKASAVINLFITAIDADGGIIDRWSLHNAWISQANFGEFDYSGDELMSFDVTVKYDYATYNTAGENEGPRRANAGKDFKNISGLGAEVK